MIRHLFQQFSLAMAATSFAEEGEHETARILLENSALFGGRYGSQDRLNRTYAG